MKTLLYLFMIAAFANPSLQDENLQEMRSTSKDKFSDNLIAFFGPSQKNVLIFIDGKEVDNLDNIEVDDIHSFSIFKSEPAVEMFGSRASNGAIVVTTKQDKKITMPNVFRADKTEERKEIGNDEFRKFFLLPSMQSPTSKYRFVVFNDKGDLLFETDDVNSGWNGYHEGELCYEGVYNYRIEGEFQNGTRFLEVGNVLLVH